MSLVPGKPLLLYVATIKSSLRALLAQHNEEGKEHDLYYLSRTMDSPELNYSPIEKICMALVFTLQKLRHYLLTMTIHLISRGDPLKYIMSRPSVQGRIAKWTVCLSAFDIHYVLQWTVKRQSLANFLVVHPVPDDSSL